MQTVRTRSDSPLLMYGGRIGFSGEISSISSRVKRPKSAMRLIMPSNRLVVRLIKRVSTTRLEVAGIDQRLDVPSIRSTEGSELSLNPFFWAQSIPCILLPLAVFVQCG